MSKFREQVKLEKQSNTAPNKSMGPAKVDVPLPQKYLLKHSKEPKLPESMCPAFKTHLLKWATWFTPKFLHYLLTLEWFYTFVNIFLLLNTKQE